MRKRIVREVETVPPGTEFDATDRTLSAVTKERRQLLGLAYRLLGSMAEAEDAVQETYARWFAMSREEQRAITSPGAWLNKVASRICLNQLNSARVRRENYIGNWIPEPLPEHSHSITTRVDGAGDPADRVTLDDSISMAFLVMLESMTPAERVAFILHEVFRYPFADVAEIVGRTPAACRQLASSARRRISSPHSPPTPPSQRAAIVRYFKDAWQAKDIDALVSLLDPEATATTDGGGRVTALLEPVHGALEIAQRCINFARLESDLSIAERAVNGQPGLVAMRDEDVMAVAAFEIVGKRVTQIWTVLNPEKLQLWMSN